MTSSERIIKYVEKYVTLNEEEQIQFISSSYNLALQQGTETMYWKVHLEVML